MNLLFLVVPTVAALAADAVDIYFTRKGIKAGNGVENNPVTVAVTGTNKPSVIQLALADEIWIAPAVIGGALAHNALFYCASAWLTVMVMKHLIGAHQWTNLAKGIVPKTQISALEKIIGL